MNNSTIGISVEQQMVSATYLRLVAKELGINQSNADRFLRGTSITYDQLLSIDGKLSFQDLITVAQNTFDMIEEPAIGLIVGAKLNAACHGLLGMVLMSSPTVKAMLEAYIRYAEVSAQFLTASLKTTSKYYVLEIEDLPLEPQIRNSLFELIFSTGQCVFEQAIGKQLTEVIFKFAHPEPEYVDKYREILHSTSQFSCDRYQVCIPIAVGNLPSLFADESLLRSIRLMCEDHLKEHQPLVYLVDCIKKLLYKNPGYIWTNEDIANALNMSPRTLARKLKNESTTYKEIREETQKETAARYLIRENISVERVGYLMGYTDSSNFRRSFKRWFGVTPTEYLELRKQS